VPARAPVIVQPPKQALDLPVVKPKVIAPAPPRPKPAVVKKSGPVATPVIVPQKPLQPVVAETGLVSISSWPKARVYVDGVYLQDSPLNRHALPVGAHTVRLVTDDGRTHQFAVEAVQDRTVRKIWHFDENAWIESVD
jgi:hypothetical protein